MTKIAIITGPRAINSDDEMFVATAIAEIIRRGFQIYVGDAKGVDHIAYVQAAEAYNPTQTLQARQFFPLTGLGRTPQGLAERSARMVLEATRAGSEVICLAFPNKPCPAGITPARSWRTGEPPSGTWSTLALAIGHNVETWIFPIDDFATPPFWCGAPEIFMKNEAQEIHGWQCKPLPLF